MSSPTGFRSSDKVSPSARSMAESQPVASHELRGLTVHVRRRPGGRRCLAEANRAQLPCSMRSSQPAPSRCSCTHPGGVRHAIDEPEGVLSKGPPDTVSVKTALGQPFSKRSMNAVLPSGSTTDRMTSSPSPRAV